MATGPGDGVIGRVPVENGHTGDDGAGAADAGTATDLDELPRPGPLVGVAHRGGGELVITWDPEVRPVDPVRLPSGGVSPPSRRQSTKIKPEIGHQPGG